MLLSGQFEGLAESDEYQRDLITYTILTIIFSSFMYLFLAFLREINFARSIGTKFTRAKWRAAIRKQIAINRRKNQAARKFQDLVYMVMRRHNVGTYGKTSLTISFLRALQKKSVLFCSLFFITGGSMAMTNLQEVKRRKSKIDPGVEGRKKSGVLSDIFGKPKRKSLARKISVDHDSKIRKISMSHDTAHSQVNVWDSGPDMNEIMPAAHTSSPMRHVDQDAMSVQEVEDQDAMSVHEAEDLY
jgi:hypothetical protein